MNKTATISRPTQIGRPGGDRETVNTPLVVSNVPCTFQEKMGPQQYLPGGQVAIRQSRIWFKAGVDVQENDFIALSDGTNWRVEHVFDDAGRGHHLICEVVRYT